jgi:hypothetical protein
LSATGIWTFDGFPGGYIPSSGLNKLDLEIKNIDIEPGGKLVFTHTDICIGDHIDLSQTVLDLDAGSPIKVGTGGKLTLSVGQVNELRAVLQGVPVGIVGSVLGYHGWAVEQGLMENAGFSDDASGDGFAYSFHCAMKIPARTFVQTDYTDLVPTIDTYFLDDKATLCFQIPDLVTSESGQGEYKGIRVIASGNYAEQSNGFYRLNVRLRSIRAKRSRKSIGSWEHWGHSLVLTPCPTGN